MKRSINILMRRAVPMAAALLLTACSVPRLTQAPTSAQPAVPESWSQSGNKAAAVQAQQDLAIATSQAELAADDARRAAV